jgi:uroporphyrinogen-III synthase
MSAAAKPVIWITRPQPGADKSAAAIAAMGFHPVVVPLTEVAATEPAIDPAEAARADAVVVTSGNAVRLVPDTLVTALFDKAVYTVGAATKADALARGFRDVRSADGAVDDLVALVSAREKPGSALVYLCGRRRTGDLEGKLARKGLNCLVCEVYSTKIVSHMTDNLEKKLSAGSPDAVLFHSALSARAFAEHAKVQSSQAYEKTLVFAISERVAMALPDYLKDRITVAEEPTEQSLLAALCDIVSAGRD